MENWSVRCRIKWYRFGKVSLVPKKFAAVGVVLHPGAMFDGRVVLRFLGPMLRRQETQLETWDEEAVGDPDGVDLAIVIFQFENEGSFSLDGEATNDSTNCCIRPAKM